MPPLGIVFQWLSTRSGTDFYFFCPFSFNYLGRSIHHLYLNLKKVQALLLTSVMGLLILGASPCVLPIDVRIVFSACLRTVPRTHGLCTVLSPPLSSRCLPLPFIALHSSRRWWCVLPSMSVSSWLCSLDRLDFIMSYLPTSRLSLGVALHARRSVISFT